MLKKWLSCFESLGTNEKIFKLLVHLSPEMKKKVIHDNAARHYTVRVLEPEDASKKVAG